MPSEIGALTALTAKFYLNSNQLCGWDAIPTEVAALSTSVSEWQVATGNEGIGTPCCETLDGFKCLPVGLPTATTSIDASSSSYTGTIPTEAS